MAKIYFIIDEKTHEVETVAERYVRETGRYIAQSKHCVFSAKASEVLAERIKEHNDKFLSPMEK